MSKGKAKPRFVTDAMLKRAWESGRALYDDYHEEWSGDATSNREMELAFIWGVLGYPFKADGVRGG